MTDGLKEKIHKLEDEYYKYTEGPTEVMGLCEADDSHIITNKQKYYQNWMGEKFCCFGCLCKYYGIKCI